MVNKFFNVGNIEFIGDVKVENSTYTLSEFHKILNKTQSIIDNSSTVIVWDKQTAYNVNDFVTYKGLLYVSTTDNNVDRSPDMYDGIFWKKYGDNDGQQVISVNGLGGEVSFLEGVGINIQKNGNNIIISNSSVGKVLSIPIKSGDFSSTSYSYQWSDNVCVIQHNLGGYVFGQLYDDTNHGTLIPVNYVSGNVVTIDFPQKIVEEINNGATYKLLLSVNLSGSAANTNDLNNYTTDSDINIKTSKNVTITAQNKINVTCSSITLNGNNPNTVGGFVTVQAGGKLPPLDGSLLTNLPDTSSVATDYTLRGTGKEINPLTVVVGNGLAKGEGGITLDLTNYLSDKTITLNYANSSYIQMKNNGLTLFSTNKVNLSTNDLRLNGHILNGANGLVKLDNNGQIDQSMIKFNQKTLDFMSWGESNSNQLGKLTSLMNSYDYFMSYLVNNFEVKEIYCTMKLTTQGGDIILDVSNVDNDIETTYLYELEGYVLGVESYITNQDTQMKRFFPDISYDKSYGEYGKSSIYFSELEYETIRDLISPKNKVKIQYVKLKNKG